MGFQKYILTDIGLGFRPEEYKGWCKQNEVEPECTEPGKPMQNGYIDRFNRTFREDILDATLFISVSPYKRVAEKWNEDYNRYHPHDSLGKKSPKEFASRQNASLVEASPCQT